MASRLDLNNKPFLQLILILCLCLISVILFSVIGGLLTVVLYVFDISKYAFQKIELIDIGITLFLVIVSWIILTRTVVKDHFYLTTQLYRT